MHAHGGATKAESIINSKTTHIFRNYIQILL